MTTRAIVRMLRESDPRLVWKFAWNFGWKGMRAVQKFEKRQRLGENFPAFTVVSITTSCNLSCQGCWVSQPTPPVAMSMEALDALITASKSKGSYFFGLLGGEPLLYPRLFELIERHPDCYFQLFTNGTLLTREVAKRMRQLGNITPLISIEGMEKVSDERRGGQKVFQRAIEGVENCAAEKLITGVAVSVCQSNYDELVRREFIDFLVQKKVQYLWYYIYRPVGAHPCPELALSQEKILGLRRFMVDQRCSAPLMLVDAYWDHLGRAVCPAAMGLSHHVNPSGQIEFCPPVQFAKDRIHEGQDLVATYEKSAFLPQLRQLAAENSRGCILLDDPQKLYQFVCERHASDSSGRGTALAELKAMRPLPSHHVPGQEIPEKSWMYRFAKKYWFFGFGAYG
jgi:MoaA/NifB/PqqE/SkfB family radical SAM enzyme